MLGKSLRDGEDARACPQGESGVRVCARQGGEALLEPGKPSSGLGAAALRQRGERSVDLRGEGKARRDATNLDDLRTDGERGEVLRALQWRGVVRQCCEPAIH